MKGYVMQLQPFPSMTGRAFEPPFLWQAVPCGVNGVPIQKDLTKSLKRRFMKNFVLAVGFVPPFVTSIMESTSMTPNSGQNAMDAVRALTFVRRMQKNAWW